MMVYNHASMQREGWEYDGCLFDVQRIAVIHMMGYGISRHGYHVPSYWRKQRWDHIIWDAGSSTSAVVYRFWHNVYACCRVKCNQKMHHNIPYMDGTPSFIGTATMKWLYRKGWQWPPVPHITYLSFTTCFLHRNQYLHIYWVYVHNIYVRPPLSTNGWRELL